MLAKLVVKFYRPANSTGSPQDESHSQNVELVCANSIQNSSHMLPHYVWYSSSIPLRVASPLFSFSFSSLSLRYSDFPCPKGVLEDSWGEILSVCRTCHLELSFFLCQAFHVTLLFQVKTENPPLLFCLLISRFLSSVSIKPMTTMLVFLRGVCMCVCV